MIFYTVVTNNDMVVPDIDMPDEIPCILYHDFDFDVKPKGYELVKIPKLFDNPVFTQRYYKILSHRFIRDETIYFDSTTNLTRSVITNKSSRRGANICTINNCYRRSYFDELFDWFISGYISLDQAIKFTSFLKDIHFDFTKFRAYHNWFVYRKYSQETIVFNELWWSYFIKFGIRDQLPFGIASAYLDMKPATLEVNEVCDFFNPRKYDREDKAYPQQVKNKSLIMDFKNKINKILQQDNKINAVILGHRLNT